MEHSLLKQLKIFSWGHKFLHREFFENVIFLPHFYTIHYCTISSATARIKKKITVLFSVFFIKIAEKPLPGGSMRVCIRKSGSICET